MRNHILKTGAALLAAGIFLFVSNGNFSAFAASDKKVIVDDAVTSTTLTGGDWAVTGDGITYRGGSGVALCLSGYETAGNNVNAVATISPVTFAADEDLMAEFDVSGVSSSTVHFGVMQGVTFSDSSAWECNYAYANTFGYYAGPSSRTFTFESAGGDAKFAEEYIGGEWRKSPAGSVDLSEKAYRVRQIFRSDATGEQTAIDVRLLPVCEDGLYNFEGEDVRKFRVTANGVAQAIAGGFSSQFRIGDGYVGINVEDVGVNEGGSVTLDNVRFSKISSTGTEIKSVIAEADFEDRTLSEGLCAYGLSAKSVGFSEISDVSFTDADANDLIGLRKEISPDGNVGGTLLDVSFTVCLPALSQGNLIGAFFGGSQVGRYDTGRGVTAGFALKEGKTQIEIYVGGELAASKTAEQLVAEKAREICFAVEKAPGGFLFRASVGGSSVTAEIGLEDVAGYLSIGNFTENPTSFYIDDLKINAYSYAEYAGRTMTADFDGGMPDVGKWNVSTDGAVRLSNDLVPEEAKDQPRYTAESGVKFEDGVMKFDRTGDGSSFGPKYSYGDWRFSFDLMSFQNEATYTESDGVRIYTPAAPWIGFSFRKGSLNSSFAASSVQTLLMTRRKTEDPARSEFTVTGWQIPAFDGSAVATVNAPVDAPLSVRITAKDRTVTLEYKLWADDDTQWRTLVSLDDTETAGYMSFSSTNWTNFSVDNVRVENLDELYDPANYPDLKINGSDRVSFNKAAPEDVSFSIGVGRYEFEVIGSRITEDDYVVDADANIVVIKKEFLRKFPDGSRNFYIRNQYGEELCVVVNVKTEEPEPAEGTGCRSSVSSAWSVLALLAAGVAIVKKGETR